MEGLTRVFAGEFCRSTCSLRDGQEPGSAVLLTPGGAFCRRVFIAGVLTETAESGGMLRCRLADPTGVFPIGIPEDGRSPLAGGIRSIAVPAFLAVSGRVQTAARPDEPPALRAESVRVVDRAVRDAWVARTAVCTLERIGLLAAALAGTVQDERARAVIRHYRTTPGSLLELTGLVESALAGIRPAAPAAEGPVTDPRQTILGIIRDRQGPRGIAVDDVVAAAALAGISEEKAMDAVRSLVQEDELYQPQKGSVRLL